MSYHEGSNWQAKKEDEGMPLYEREQFEKEVNKRFTPNIPIGFSSDYQKGYNDGQKDAEQWKAEYENCRHLIESLCELKRWKDENINMLEYAAFKPKAWEAVKEFLKKYQH